MALGAETRASAFALQSPVFSLQTLWSLRGFEMIPRAHICSGALLACWWHKPCPYVAMMFDVYVWCMCVEAQETRSSSLAGEEQVRRAAGLSLKVEAVARFCFHMDMVVTYYEAPGTRRSRRSAAQDVARASAEAARNADLEVERAIWTAEQAEEARLKAVARQAAHVHDALRVSGRRLPSLQWQEERRNDG